jgi:hypothetical protein
MAIEDEQRKAKELERYQQLNEANEAKQKPIKMALLKQTLPDIPAEQLEQLSNMPMKEIDAFIRGNELSKWHQQLGQHYTTSDELRRQGLAQSGVMGQQRFALGQQQLNLGQQRLGLEQQRLQQAQPLTEARTQYYASRATPAATAASGWKPQQIAQQWRSLYNTYVTSQQIGKALSFDQWLAAGGREQGAALGLPAPDSAARAPVQSPEAMYREAVLKEPQNKALIDIKWREMYGTDPPR